MAAVIEIPDDLDVRVEALAARSGRSKTAILLEVLRGVLEDIEDLYEFERVMERIRAGEERVFSAEEMRRELGLEG
jgi:RHH-type rel operon transcriptional repressor/antitoxin RelB